MGKMSYIAAVQFGLLQADRQTNRQRKLNSKGLITIKNLCQNVRRILNRTWSKKKINGERRLGGQISDP